MSSPPPKYEHLVRAINTLVADKTREFNFLWGTLQITTDNGSGTFHNAANTGPPLDILFGAFEGGNFASGTIKSSDHGMLYAYDGRALHHSAESTGRGFLMEFFLHSHAPK